MASDPENRNSRVSRIRWWPAVAIVVLATLALVWIRAFVGVQRQDKIISSFAALLFAMLLLLLWVLLFSRMRWRLRLAIVGGVVMLVIGASAVLRIRGVSGDLVPIIAWRWSGEPMALEPGGVAVGDLADSRDFPQFQGPTRDGNVPGVRLATDWIARPPRLLWRRPVGEAWSGFAVAGNRAVTLEQHGSEERVTCYDLTTGRPLWSHGDPGRWEDPLGGPGPRATPAIADGRVYTLGGTGRLNALDLASGKRIWTTDIIEDAAASIPTYGVSASPLVLGDVVIVVAGGGERQSLVAYDRDTGERAWAGGDAPAAYSSPLLADLNGRRQLLVLNEVALSAHDPGDGTVLWNREWPGQTQRVSQPVVLPGDRVFVSTGYGIGGKLFHILDDGGSLRAETVWENLNLKAKFSNVVHRDGYLYGLDDGILVSIDLADGSRAWKRGRYGHGQILLVGDLLVVLSERGEVALVDADPGAFRERAREKVIDGKTWNHPALAGRYLLVRNDREAACLELPTLESTAP